VISWESVTGRLYTLRVSADSSNTVWLPVPDYEDLRGTGADISYTNPVPQTSGAYRAEVRMDD
jgi:hypothetical protein